VATWEQSTVAGVETKTATEKASVTARKVTLSLPAETAPPSLESALGLTGDEEAAQGITKRIRVDTETGARMVTYHQGQLAPVFNGGDDQTYVYWVFVTTPLEYQVETRADMPWSPKEAATDGVRVFFAPWRSAQKPVKTAKAFDPMTWAELWTRDFEATGVARSGYAHHAGHLWIWIDGVLYKLDAGTGATAESWDHPGSVQGNGTTDDLMIAAGQLVYHDREEPDTATDVETTLKRRA